MADADPLPRARPGGLRGRRPRLVITDAVRDGHLAFFVKREVQAEVLALQNGENSQALVAVVIAMFLGVGTAAFFRVRPRPGGDLGVSLYGHAGSDARRRGRPPGVRHIDVHARRVPLGKRQALHGRVRAFGAQMSHYLFHQGPAPRSPARGTSDDPVFVFDDNEGKRVDQPIEVG